MRIGFFNASLPQPGRKPGGVDVHLDRLADALAHRGHELRFYSYDAPDGPRAYDHRRLTPASRADSKLARMTLVPASLNALDLDGLDVMHLHGDDWFFFRRRLPTVRTFYGSALHEARSATRLRRRASQYTTFGLELLSSRLATATYGLIPGDAAAYRSRGHLPCGVGAPPQLELDRDDPPTILFVGTWEGRKRGRMLHEAFVDTVRPAVPGARLVMVSDHCDPADGVEWHRRPSDDELAQLYASAWLFCLPSAYEGFGIPYVEAMAHGTPVVATSNPGADFVLQDGSSGVMVTDASLGRELVGLLGDPERRRALALAGVERARDFSWDIVTQMHVDAYRTAVDRHGAGRRDRSGDPVG